MNRPTQSKINATAGIGSAVNVGVYILAQRDLIPQDAVVDALVVANVVSQGLIVVFRTWFTGTK